MRKFMIQIRVYDKQPGPCEYTGAIWTGDKWQVCLICIPYDILLTSSIDKFKKCIVYVDERDSFAYESIDGSLRLTVGSFELLDPNNNELYESEDSSMELSIFAKKRQTREGKSYNIYVARMPKKNGEVIPVRVKFREEAGVPRAESCPMNIIINKEDCNMAKTEYVREDTGEVGTSYTLWVTKWQKGSDYVDTSLDEFDI